MGGASTGPRKWMPLSFACNSGNGEGMDRSGGAGGFSNEEGGLEAAGVQERSRSGRERKTRNPITEMSP